MAIDGIVLVHGGFHGAWCWERLLPHLESPVLAVDLPGRGKHPAEMAEVTVEACVRSVISDMDRRQICSLHHVCRRRHGCGRLV